MDFLAKDTAFSLICVDTRLAKTCSDIDMVTCITGYCAISREGLLEYSRGSKMSIVLGQTMVASHALINGFLCKGRGVIPDSAASNPSNPSNPSNLSWCSCMSIQTVHPSHRLCLSYLQIMDGCFLGILINYKYLSEFRDRMELVHQWLTQVFVKECRSDEELIRKMSLSRQSFHSDWVQQQLDEFLNNRFGIRMDDDSMVEYRENVNRLKSCIVTAEESK